MAQLALPLVIASGVTSAAQQRTAGQIADLESKTRAKQIETQAAAREADRKERLARAVSSQVARGGTTGIAFEGSPLSVLAEDVRREKEATQRDDLMTQVNVMAERAKGKVAKSQARGAAIMGLLQTGATAASI